MARTNNLTNFLNDVATAIKTKLGDSTAIPAAQFDSKIMDITTGGNYQAKSITIQTNGNYTLSPDTGYDAMNSVSISVSVPQSSGVKLFQTEQAMQNDPNPSQGDLAVVYRDTRAVPSPGDTISSWNIYPIVKLSAPVTSYKSMSMGNVFQGQIQMTLAPDRCNIQYSSRMSTSLYVKYETSDGKTYTRTDGGQASITFSRSMTFPSNADEQCLNFFKTGDVQFGGLFEYKEHTVLDTSHFLGKKVDTESTDAEDIYVENLNVDYSSIMSDVGDYATAEVAIVDTFTTSQSLDNKTVISPTKFYKLKSVNASSMYRTCIIKENNKFYIGTYGMGDENTTNTLITVINGVPSTSSLSATDFIQSSISGYYYYPDIQLDYGIGFFDNNNSSQGFYDSSIQLGSSSIYMPSPDENAAESVYCRTYDITSYTFADSQLTLDNANKLLPNIIGYGPNGIVTGDGSIYNNLDFKNYIESMTSKNLLDIRPLLISNKQITNVPVSITDKVEDSSDGIVTIQNFMQLPDTFSRRTNQSCRPVGDKMYVISLGTNSKPVFFLYNTDGTIIDSLDTSSMTNAISNTVSIDADKFYYNETTGEFHHVLMGTSATRLHHLWYDTNGFHIEEIEENYDAYRYIDLGSYIHNDNGDDYILYHQNDYGIYKYNVRTKARTLIASQYTSSLPGYKGIAMSNGTNVYLLTGNGSTVSTGELIILDLNCDIISTTSLSATAMRYLIKSGTALYIYEGIGDNTANIYAITDLSTILDTFYTFIYRSNLTYFPDKHILLSTDTSYYILESATSTALVRLEPAYNDYWHDVRLYTRTYLVENNKLVFYVMDYDRNILRGEVSMDKKLSENSNGKSVIPCHTGNSNNSSYISYFCIE